MSKEECEQQHLNVRAINIGVGQDADLPVPQAGEVDCVTGAVWVHAQRHRNVMHFGICKEPVALGLPGVEHLPPQRENGLRLFVSAHFGRATRRISLHQEDLVTGKIGGLAVGEFARQHRHTRALSLLHLLG